MFSSLFHVCCKKNPAEQPQFFKSIRNHTNTLLPTNTYTNMLIHVNWMAFVSFTAQCLTSLSAIQIMSNTYNKVLLLKKRQERRLLFIFIQMKHNPNKVKTGCFSSAVCIFIGNTTITILCGQKIVDREKFSNKIWFGGRSDIFASSIFLKSQ